MCENEWGNNPAPLVKNPKDRCCNICTATKVILKRFDNNFNHESDKTGKKYMLIDPCYLEKHALNSRFGKPVATFDISCDGIFFFGAIKVSVESGKLHVHEVPADDFLSLQGLTKNPDAIIGYLKKIPTYHDVFNAITNYRICESIYSFI